MELKVKPYLLYLLSLDKTSQRAHYFQAPAPQAKTRPVKAFKTRSVFLSYSDSDLNQ